jgi:hypothetical protein
VQHAHARKRSATDKNPALEKNASRAHQSLVHTVLVLIELDELNGCLIIQLFDYTTMIEVQISTCWYYTPAHFAEADLIAVAVTPAGDR